MKTTVDENESFFEEYLICSLQKSLATFHVTLKLFTRTTKDVDEEIYVDLYLQYLKQTPYNWTRR